MSLMNDQTPGNEILAQLVHEIGNPLNGMCTTIDLLERRCSSREKLDRYTRTLLGDLKKEIHLLKTYFEEIRSSPHLLSVKWKFTPTDVQGLIAEIMRMEQCQFTAAGITVREEYEPGLPLIAADGEKLKRALFNLFKNAAEAMPGGGTITVRGVQGPNRVELDIADTGCGIPHARDVFSCAVSTKPKGMGLGLAITHQIVQAHCGTIDYVSDPQRGTVFHVVLPIHSAVSPME